MPETEPIVIEQDRIVMRGDWVEEIVYGVQWSETDNIDAFNALFEVDSEDYLAEEDYYQGITSTRLIKRKSDGRLFGYSFWHSPGNDGMESDVSSNGEDHGFEYVWDDDLDDIRGGAVYVWLPAVPFTITGYTTEATS